jgi:haloalkane dehalogenase
MDVLRTPDERFADLADYPFEPHWLTLESGEGDTLRMHYVDEGPRDGTVVVLLHGEPTWSYLYRTMIPPLVAAGHRVLAPDLIGFGKSDKPTQISDYTYQRHVDWVLAWMDTLGLDDITLFGQDWGSFIGLRIAGEQPGRFARIMISDGFLPTAHRSMPLGFKAWRAFAVRTPVFPAGLIVEAGTVRWVGSQARAAYVAPFPSRQYQAGARAFPRLVPTDPDDVAVPANRAAWDVLGTFERPFLTVFGTVDPVLGSADRALIKHVPGAKGQPHDRIRGGHFIQEDAGPELARRMIDWMASS